MTQLYTDDTYLLQLNVEQTIEQLRSLITTKVQQKAQLDKEIQDLFLEIKIKESKPTG